MALTRKMLKAMGIEDEKIDQIVEAHTETVDALKQQCEEFKQKAADFDGVQKELDKVKAANESGEDWKAKYEKLQADVDNEKKQTAIKTAYKKLLLDSGVSPKYVDSVLKISDLSEIKVDKNGDVEGAAEEGNKIKSKYADFIVHTEDKKDIPPTPPQTGKVKMTKDEIVKISDASKRLEAIRENPEAFGLQ